MTVASSIEKLAKAINNEHYLNSAEVVIVFKRSQGTRDRESSSSAAVRN